MARRDRGREGEVVAKRLVEAQQIVGEVLVEWAQVVVDRPLAAPVFLEQSLAVAVVFEQSLAVAVVERPLAVWVEADARRHQRWIPKRQFPERQSEENARALVRSGRGSFVEGGETRGA